jgi:hypothetical protein
VRFLPTTGKAEVIIKLVLMELSPAPDDARRLPFEEFKKHIHGTLPDFQNPY